MPKCSRCGNIYEQTKCKASLCLSCRREYNKQWRIARKAAGNPVISTPLPKEYFREYGKTYYQREAVKARKVETERKRVNSPEHQPQIMARRAVRNAIRRGDLIRQPCEVCGKTKAEAHHEDYSKQLDVNWLCREHHIQIHAKAEGAVAADALNASLEPTRARLAEKLAAGKSPMFGVDRDGVTIKTDPDGTRTRGKFDEQGDFLPFKDQAP